VIEPMVDIDNTFDDNILLKTQKEDIDNSMLKDLGKK